MKKLLICALALAGPASAEVKSATATSFEVSRTATVKASPAAVYAQIGRIGEWWNPAHSYSGKAANLSLVLKGGGCFCETLAQGGSVEHARVVYADPASAVRLSGALGPLQSEAVVGTLAWSFKSAPDGGTEISQTYLVSGTARSGLQAFAAPVDQVLGEQFDRLTARLNK